MLPVDVLYATQKLRMALVHYGSLMILTFWNTMANLETSMSMIAVHPAT